MTTSDKFVDIIAGLTLVAIIVTSLLRGRKHKNVDNSTNTEDKNQDNQTSLEERSDDSENSEGTSEPYL